MLSTKRFRSTWGAAAVLVTISLVSAASTETCAEDLAAPSPEKGYELAQRFCKGCHLIEDRRRRHDTCRRPDVS
jgi:uncharacterized paraquat-inducible protein A